MPIKIEEVAIWHIADDPAASAFVRYWANNGHGSILARDGLSANDPKRTFWLRNPSLLALPRECMCGNIFDRVNSHCRINSYWKGSRCSTLSNSPSIAELHSPPNSSHKLVREVVARAVSDPNAVLKGIGEPKRAEVQKLYHAPDLTILNVI